MAAAATDARVDVAKLVAAAWGLYRFPGIYSLAGMDPFRSSLSILHADLVASRPGPADIEARFPMYERAHPSFTPLTVTGSSHLYQGRRVLETAHSA